jgi:hypothetical protein
MTTVDRSPYAAKRSAPIAGTLASDAGRVTLIA